jgi:vWA-MoxR associated protein C-terminal domain/Trypsin-like peptidase domain
MNGMTWRARIDSADGKNDAIRGAGLLVSPHQVLTCAHVIDGLDRVLVAFPGAADGAGRPAAVRRLTDWRQPGDRGDIALVELDDPAPAGVEQCAFAPVDALQPQPGISQYELEALGFPPNLDGNGDYVKLSSSSYRDLGSEWLQADVDAAHLQRLNHGFSGAGLYAADSGRVVGMITDAILESERGGYIGRMLPLATIRRYWEPVDDLLPLAWMAAPARTALRAAVAGSAVAADLNAVLAAALPMVGPLEKLATPWAAIRYAAESGLSDPELRLRTFLGKLIHFLDASGRSRLANWAQAHMPAWAAEIAAAHAPVTSIVITLGTPTKRGKTHVKITARSLVDGIWAGPGEELLAPRDQPEKLRAQAEKLIDAQIAKLRFPEFRLEFAVRKNEFGLAFDEWRYREPGAALSRRTGLAPLIVRDATRMNPETANIFREDRLRRRWQALYGGWADRVEPVDCLAAYDSDGFQAILADQKIGAVTYASSPREEWLTVALDAGIPVMLWCRRECPADDAVHPAHAKFLADITATLSATDPDRLPDKVAELRQQAITKALKTGGGNHIGHSLTLFWDDPGRLPDPPIGGN